MYFSVYDLGTNIKSKDVMVKTLIVSKCNYQENFKIQTYYQLANSINLYKL